MVRALAALPQVVACSCQGGHGVRQRRARARRPIGKAVIRDNRFIDANLGSLLDRGATDQAAVVVPGELSLTYGRLRELTGELATALVSRGVKPGDRVATVFPNGPEAVLTFLATSMIGVSCPLNPGYKEDEFRFYLEDTGARFLLVPPDEASAARQALPAGPPPIEVELDPTRPLQISNHGGAPRRAPQPPGAPTPAPVLPPPRTTTPPHTCP